MVQGPTDLNLCLTVQSNCNLEHMSKIMNFRKSSGVPRKYLIIPRQVLFL